MGPRSYEHRASSAPDGAASLLLHLQLHGAGGRVGVPPQAAGAEALRLQIAAVAGPLPRQPHTAWLCQMLCVSSDLSILVR